MSGKENVKNALASPVDATRIAGVRTCMHMIGNDGLLTTVTGLSRATLGRAAARDKSGTFAAYVEQGAELPQEAVLQQA